MLKIADNGAAILRGKYPNIRLFNVTAGAEGSFPTKDKPRQRLPLSQQKEFKAIKNMVIQEAENLRLGVLTFEDEQLADEPVDNTRFRDPDIPDEDKRSVIEVLERDWGDDGPAPTAYLLGRLWRDGLGVIPDDEKAEMWFRRAAEVGHSDAQYALAKLLQEQDKISMAAQGLDKDGVVVDRGLGQSGIFILIQDRLPFIQGHVAHFPGRIFCGLDAI